MNLAGSMTHYKELTLTEINDMQPWEFDAYYEIINGLREKDKKKTKSSSNSWHELTEDQV